MKMEFHTSEEQSSGLVLTWGESDGSGQEDDVGCKYTDELKRRRQHGMAACGT